MKDNAQETLANYDGNARPGEMVVDLTTDPPTPYIGNTAGQLTLLTSAGSYGNTQVAGFLDAGLVGDIIPNGNSTHSLGNSTNYWANLWVANNTIYIGGVSMGMTAGNVLTVNGNAVLTNNSNTTVSTTGNITANYFLGNGSQLTGISVSTGNVTFSNQAVVGTGSQDGSGGLYLAPGTESVGNLQYLRVRGGDVATHIHLDTGNNTYFDQYFGDDNKYVKLANTGNIVVNTNNLVDASAQWTFGVDGNLTLPLGSIVYETNIPDQSLSGSAIALKPIGGTTANQQLLIYPTAADGDHIHMTSGNLYATELFLGSDNFYVKLANTGNVIINSNDGNSSNAMWTFDTDGNLTLPGNLVINGLTNVFGSNVALLQSNPNLPLLSISSGSNGGVSSLWVEDIDNVGTSNIAAVYVNPTSGSGIVRIAVGQNGGNAGPSLWDFNANGAIKFPDNTIQTTAFTGDIGDKGEKGTKGDVGAQGVQGAVGSKGEVGVQGAQGLTSDKGEIGAQGAQGAQGVQGATGAGTQGAAGPQGDVGAQGVQGATGTGAQGAAGPQGDVGAQGVQGATGTGAQGAVGAQGEVGAQGTTGAQGVQGATGTGAQGAVGAQGAQGAQGVQGALGARTYTVTNVGAGAYSIDGSSNPTLNLLRGFTYQFSVNASGHPFWIQTVSGAYSSGSIYSSGVTNGGAAVGTITFAVPYNAPSTLYYVCQFHSSMAGTINISDVGPQGAQGTAGAQGAQGVQGASGANISWPIAVYPTSGNTANDGIIFPSDPGGGSGDIASIKWYPVIGESTRLHIEANNDDNDEILIDASGSVKLQSYNKVWDFKDNGSLVFPDSTTQTTAFTANPTVNILNVKEVIETTNALSSATGTVTHNCALGHIFVHSSVSANFTANFTDVTIPANTATAFTLVINQSSTAYVANLVQIGGVAQTVNWQGSTTAPAGNANKKDVISFSVVNNNGTFITLGQLTTFG
jgi:hypothetical protein